MRRTWKSRVIRAAAKLLAVTVTATSCLSGMAFTARAEGYGKNGVVRDMTSQQLVEDMGLGYNIGNTFDSIGSFITETDPWQYQKAWGNDLVSQLFIQKIKEGGFKTVRLPVSWAHWIDANNQINPGYLQAVQTVVDWCMDEDLYVILNVHHDSGAADTSWIRNAATDWDGTSAKYAAVWTQISSHFMNYGDHLIFEGMNEVEFPAAPTMSRQYEILNAMNQLFVDSVRATGGNNAVRHLLIPGYNTDIKKTCDRRYQMPNDPANHCILSIHYYSPSPFCVAEHDVDWAVPVTTWGSEEDIQNVEADLDILAEHFLSKGTPVIIGEYGVLTEDNKEKESIRAYLKTVPEIIMQYGMCPVLWDTSNAGDMKTIERITGEFYDPVVKANYQALAQKKAFGQIQKKVFDFPEYQRVDVPITPGGWTSLESAFEPEKVVGVAFELDCASDWDSYGGGGLYLDGWDNMPQWSFNSVFDEIVYMFSAEEKARLHDQLAVLIFWTDESKGGSRREELSIKGNKITLLYGEDEQVHAPRLTTTKASGGSGGGGGGKGSSRYPNNSTEPVGDETNNERTNLYHSLHEGKEVVKEGVLKQGRNSKTSEEDTETGAYKIKIKDFCPDYAVGDKVRVNVSYLSDEGSPSIALVTTENGYTSSDDDGIRNKNTLVWDCVPPDGEVTLNLWYLGNNKYFMYKVSCEILEKVPGFAVEDINNNDSFGEPEISEDTDDKGNPTVTMTYPFSLVELARVSDVELGEDCRIKLTVYPVADPQEGDEYSVYFEDVNGAKVTGSLEGSSVTLVGTPKDDTIYFAFTTKNTAAAQRARAAFPPVSFSNFVLKQLPAMDILAELVSIGRVELSSTKANPRPIEETDKAEDGVKVYFEYDGNDVKEEDLGGALVVNGDWDYTNEKWDVRSDENGEYIWCAGSAQSTVMLSLWTIKSSFRITSVVGVRKAEKAPTLAENEELMTEGEDGKYHVPEGKRLAAIRFKTSGGGNAYGAMLMMNADPWGTWIDFHDGEEKIYKFETRPLFTELELENKFVDYMIFVYSDEAEEPTPEEPDKPQPEGPELKENEALAVKKDDGNYYVPEGKGNPTGMRFTGTNLWGANISVNGGYWASESPDKDLTFGKDQNVEYVSFALYDGNENAEITYVIFIYGDNDAEDPTPEQPKPEEPDKPQPEEPDEPQPEEPVLKDGEIQVEAAEDGKYYVPEGKGTPKAIRFNITGGSGHVKLALTLNYNDWASGSEGWINYTENEDTTHTFADGVEFERLTLDGDGEEITINNVVFIYSDSESTDSEIEVEAAEDGKYYVPEGKGTPKAIRFNITGGSGHVKLALTLNYNDWASGSEGWINYVENEDTTHTFADGVEFERLTLDGDGEEITINSVIFIYTNDEPATTSLMKTIANNMLYRMPGRTLADNEELIELEAIADENGIYYLPEDMDAELMGIRAEVASDSKEVSIIFDEDSDTQVKVKPENKMVYYFFDGDADVESIQFKGQRVKNVTFLYWNAENEEDTEEEVQTSDEETKPSKKAKPAIEKVQKPVEEAQKPEEETKDEVKKPVEESEETKDEVKKPAEESKETEDEVKAPAEDEKESVDNTDKNDVNKAKNETKKPSSDVQEASKDENDSKAPAENDEVKDEEEDKASSKDSETAVKDEDKDKDKDEEEDADHSDRETQDSDDRADADREKQDSNDDKRQTEDADKSDSQETKTDKIQAEVKDDSSKADDAQAADKDEQKAGDEEEDRK